MKITIELGDEDLEALIVHRRYQGKFKKLKSNAKFCNGLEDLLAFMRQAKCIEDLSLYRRFNFEALKHQYTGLYSMRIYRTEPWRMILRPNQDSISIHIIEINKHYGND